jgi:hypothetical protein
MPWDYKPWGCGKGAKGSCNSTHLQFEICEDGLTDKNYFNKVYKEACELTAYLCDMYNLDPHGHMTLNGVKVPVILCHQDSYRLGLGGNHSDVYHWFNKHGKTMDDVRNDFAALMKKTVNATTTTTPSTSISTSSTSSVKKDDVVKISSNATYYTGKSIPSWVKNKTWIVKSVSGDRAVIDKSEDGKYSICSPVNAKYLTKVVVFKPYIVRVTTSALNIRSGAGILNKKVGVIRDKGAYTIVEEKKVLGQTWGKLRSGAGWICLSGYTKKV